MGLVISSQDPKIAFAHKSETARMAQVARIAAAEPVGSPNYVTHVGLLSFAAACGALLFGAWLPALFTIIYLTTFTTEKVVSAHVVRTNQPRYYWWLLVLLFARGVAFNMIVVSIWSLDGDVFKFAAAALLVVATINVFVFHATHLEIIVAIITPLWLCYLAITALAFADMGLAIEPVMFLIITLCVVPYFIMALGAARDQWTKNDIMQQSLSHTQKLDALGKLVAGVAHDFNNILTVTRGNAELLADIRGPERDVLVGEIIKASDRGSALAGQLLAFGRRTDLTPARINVADLLVQNMTLLRRVVPVNIALTSNTARNLPDILVDKHQLETAIMNLVINARDAITGSGQIDIGASMVTFDERDIMYGQSKLKPGNYVLICVSDTGSGIPEDIQDSIFDPFFTTKDVGEGSGLGLSMVIGFAEQSAGGVRLESKVGMGTRVSLCLPALPELDA